MEKTPDPVRWWDWASLALLFVLLETVASRLVATTWTPYLYLTQTATYMAYVIGTALGYSRFSQRVAQWLSFFYMIILLPLQWTLVIDQNTTLEEQLQSVGGRLFFSTADFLARRPVEDPLFFVVIMTLLFWLMGAWAGYVLVRDQNYLSAVLPSAIGLLVIQNYHASQSRIWFLGFFAFMALLLLGRLHFLQNKNSWRERRVFLSPDNSIELTSSMAIAAGLLILVSWTIPASVSSWNSAARVWEKATSPWRELTGEMENAVSALESPSGGKRGEFFGTELALGRGFPLADTVMFEVDVPDLPSDQKPPRYYWRGRTYDYFTDGQWYTTGTIRENYEGGKAQNVEAYGNTTPNHFVFNTRNSTFSLLYAPSQPVALSRGGTLFNSPAGNAKDVVAWHANPWLQAGESYQVESILINPNTQQLREAGVEYPEWIRQKYLQMPPDFSTQVRQLALEVTANAETPYDKTVALTNYLRGNIEYSQTVPAKPRNADFLEWILFDLKKGYCVYYATSEVLMLRSLGIPARMAVGFAQGERIVSENLLGEERAEDEGITATSYLVRKLNAHAWPEVYFPNIGWVEFEPTGNQSPLERPLPPIDPGDLSGAVPNRNFPQEDSLLEDDQTPADEQPDQTTTPDLSFLPTLYLILSVGVIALLAFFLNRRYPFSRHIPALVRATIERSGMKAPNWVLHWEYWSGMSPIEKAFESINFGLHTLKNPVPLHSTPMERAQALMGILPGMTQEIKLLLDEHQTSLYTSRIADAVQARRAAFNIRKHVLIERIRYFFYGRPHRI